MLRKTYLSKARAMANAKKAPQLTHWASVAGILSAWLEKKDAQIAKQKRKIQGKE